MVMHDMVTTPADTRLAIIRVHANVDMANVDDMDVDDMDVDDIDVDMDVDVDVVQKKIYPDLKMPLNCFFFLNPGFGLYVI